MQPSQIWNPSLFRAPSIFKVCQTCKITVLFQSPSIIRTVYPRIFKDIQGYSGILIHIPPYSQVRKQGGKWRPPQPFLKTKKSPDFWKKSPACVHLWVKFFLQNGNFKSIQFLTKSSSKCPNSTNLSLFNLKKFWLRTCIQAFFFL